MNIVKAALVSNYKFLEMLQIMGASSFELAKQISQSIVKKLSWSYSQCNFCIHYKFSVD